MQAPATPADENERLADLRALNILDTPPEKRFDGLIKVASRVFDVPIAYIAMVDSDRQWFKAKCGIAPGQTSRDTSFCGHTILQHEPLIIPDATLDPRFHDNPLVVNDPHVRFYAGYPLAGPAGHNVGTFCIASPRPRELSAHELAVFGEMARLAETELNLLDLIEVQRQLLETKKRLVESQKNLARELAQAASYVRSLLPPRLNGPIHTDWRFISSSQLGGDFFNHYWLDDHRLAVYLLDVCGHGVGAALLSISVQSALRRQSLPDVDFANPAQVLAGLNRAFPMDENDNKFFSIWYGVVDLSNRSVRFSNGGHPPALCIDGQAARPAELGKPQILVGVDESAEYNTETASLPEAGRLYLFSDGAFEVPIPGHKMLGLDGFANLLQTAPSADGQRLDSIVSRIKEMHGSNDLDDDFSLLELRFD